MQNLTPPVNPLALLTTSSYYNVTINGTENKDAIWWYKLPTHECALVAGRVSPCTQPLSIPSSLLPDDISSFVSTTKKSTSGSMGSSRNDRRIIGASLSQSEVK